MSTPSFAFPQSLAEKYRPRTIAEFVGLEKPKKILAKFASAPYPSAWLFVGPPGVGKTSMALALADQIKARIAPRPESEMQRGSIEKACHDCWYRPARGRIPYRARGRGRQDDARRATGPAIEAGRDCVSAEHRFHFHLQRNRDLEPRFLSRCRVIEFSSLRDGRGDCRVSR